MDNTMLNITLEKHRKWVNNEEGGERANLCGDDLRDADLHGANLCRANLSRVNLSRADLCRADLCGANLYRANLYGANLCEADLCEANFSGVDLCWANLYGANLSKADLYGANLRGADLSRADLRGANIREANLSRADLSRADLRGANIREANLIRTNIREANLSGANIREANLCGAALYGAVNIPYIPMTCPETGSFIAWKNVGEYIIKLLIPDDAMRSSATGRKCRANKVKVLEIQNVDGEKADISSVASNYDSSFIYVLGQEITVPDFEENRFIECAPGIHFFINRQEVVEYMR